MDEIDDRILGILATNGRASFAALGEAVGLSPHGTADRVRKLERDGVITGYTARIDPAGVGRSLDAFIDVRLLPTTDPEQFERRAAKLASSSSAATATRAWMIPGPQSSRSVTKCTVAPCSGSCASRARRCVCRPGNLGSSEGWMFNIFPAKSLTKRGDRMRMNPASTINDGE